MSQRTFGFCLLAFLVLVLMLNVALAVARAAEGKLGFAMWHAALAVANACCAGLVTSTLWRA